jgi:hypothetical protein
VELEIIILSETSQAKQDNVTWSHSYMGSEKVNLTEVESKVVVTRG